MANVSKYVQEDAIVFQVATEMDMWVLSMRIEMLALGRRDSTSWRWECSCLWVSTRWY